MKTVVSSVELNFLSLPSTWKKLNDQSNLFKLKDCLEEEEEEKGNQFIGFYFNVLWL